MDSKIHKILRDFYFDKMPIQQFENYLYNDNFFQNSLDKDAYLELISLNYNDVNDINSAKSIVENCYSRTPSKNLIKDRVIDIANSMLTSSISLANGCDELAQMYEKGAKFIPIVFVGYDSEFKDKDRTNLFDMETAYGGRIREDLKNLINNLKQ